MDSVIHSSPPCGSKCSKLLLSTIMEKMPPYHRYQIFKCFQSSSQKTLFAEILSCSQRKAPNRWSRMLPINFIELYCFLKTYSFYKRQTKVDQIMSALGDNRCFLIRRCVISLCTVYQYCLIGEPHMPWTIPQSLILQHSISWHKSITFYQFSIFLRKCRKRSYQ